MEYGFDPEIKKYFRKIMATFFAGFVWMFANITAGMYFGLAFPKGHFTAGNIIFYILSITGFVALLFYYFNLWRK